MNTELNRLQAEISELSDTSRTLKERIDKARQVAADAKVPIDRVAELRERRRQYLADKHLGFGDKEALSKVNRELELAELEQREAESIAEGATAAAERLTEEDSRIQQRLSELHQRLPAALYAGHCAHASAAVAAFRDALAHLAKAHAVLQGRLLAADRYADPRQGRLFVSSGLVSSFASTLPGIPGHADAEELLFNMQPDIEAEFQAAMAMVGGKDGAAIADAAQRQRIEAAANEADRTMQQAMAAIGAA